MSCSVELHGRPPGAELGDDVDAAYLAAGVPMMVHLDMTYRCDLDCQHCYLDDKDCPELTTTEWERLLAQLHAAGTLYLSWSGGELFLRPDFLQLLHKAAELGFVNRLKTHAGLVTPELAQELTHCRVQSVMAYLKN